MKCNVCGSDNVEGSIFCEDCGSKLATPAPVIAATVAPAPAPAASPAAPFTPAPAASPAAPFTPAPAASPPAPFPPAAAVAAPVPAPPAPSAGAPPTPQILCPSCQTPNPSGSSFCENCGSSLQVAPAPAPGPFSAAVAPTPAQATPAPIPAPPAPVAPTPAPVAPAAAPVPAPPAPAPTPAPAAAPAAAASVLCPACGASNTAGSNFCEDCGASLKAAAAPAPLATASATPIPAPVASAAPAGPARLIMPNQVELPLTKEESLLGRSSPADNIYPEVDLTDLDPESYVSRRHGRILRQGGKYLYEDIGSSNGSFINGTRLQSHIQTELHDGDTLRLGRTEMTFRL